MSGASQHMEYIHHTEIDKAFVQSSIWEGDNNWYRQNRMPNLEEEDTVRN